MAATLPDHQAQARHRAEAAALLAKAIEDVEHAAVCIGGAVDAARLADLPTDGPRLALEAGIEQMRLQRGILIDEQVAMVHAYADTLRRVEDQQ